MPERRHYDEQRARDIRRISIGYAILALATGLALWLVVSGNRDRVQDIQQARVDSCRRTYEGVREIFLPFLHPDEDPKVNRNIRQFNERVDRLKARCGQQTGVER